MTAAARLSTRHNGPDGDNDDARRAGRRVRKWRLAQQPPMSQATFAQLADISVGCLQSFERGTRSTHDDNVKKIAGAMSLSVDQLLHDDDESIDVHHPLLRGLRKEDYRIANMFHHANADLKFAVKGLLNERVDEELRSRHARALVDIQLLNHDLLVAVEGLIVSWKADDENDRAKKRPKRTPER